MRSFSIIVEMGGRSRRWRDSASKIADLRGKNLYGLAEYYGPKGSIKTTGAKVFIYSRQSKRELADTFFHEMTHVFLNIISRNKKQGNREERVCEFIGYLAKVALADYSPDYGRGFKW